jgi:endonuclease-3 related protein
MSAPLALLDVYAALDRMHAWRGWHWWPDADPFEVCVGAILVQNTMWTNVERALDRLRAARALDPVAMSALPQAELEEMVRPSGQYRQKARKLRAFLDLAESHGGLEPLLAVERGALRERLLATWGIGRETADCIVCYAARQPALAIDAYTMRLFSRLGMGPGSVVYDEWQSWMLERLERERLQAAHPEPPRDLYARYHALIVMHCKHLCQKRAPLCRECELRDRCLFPGPEAPEAQARG